jgi:hypothetical protein
MPPQDLETFHFRDLHPNLFMGTTSDRYSGWIGQIYSRDRYTGRITRRTNVVGGKKFVEEVLPVDSVEEYFEHFRVLEIDYTFYRPLTEPDGTPTQNYHVLERYAQHLKDGDGLILKVPQLVFAQKLRRGEGYIPNNDYLNPDLLSASSTIRPRKYWARLWLGSSLSRNTKNSRIWCRPINWQNPSTGFSRPSRKTADITSNSAPKPI